MSNYAKIKKYDIANGDGVRVSIFFSGCHFKCENCFNSELWDFSYGIPFTEETIKSIAEFMKPNYISGLSILGGEPLDNCNAVVELAKNIKSEYPNKNIWLWTGYNFENIKFNPILDYVDVIVDGRYENNKRDLTLRFKGSSNQNIWRKENGVWIKEE